MGRPVCVPQNRSGSTQGRAPSLQGDGLLIWHPSRQTEENCKQKINQSKDRSEHKKNIFLVLVRRSRSCTALKMRDFQT